MSSDGSLSCHIPIAGCLAKKPSPPIVICYHRRGRTQNLPVTMRTPYRLSTATDGELYHLGLSTPCKSKKMMDAECFMTGNRTRVSQMS